jgi:endogenous inhibitor of DNA gyrase (YacG/DUF329 family)
MTSQATTRRCPICERPTDDAYAPFCCKRCADVDLQRWFAGVYSVPAEDQADADEDFQGDD